MIVGIIAAAEIWIGVLCLISSIYSFSIVLTSGDYRTDRGHLYQSGLLLTCFLLMTSSCVSWYSNGVDTPSSRVVLLTSNTLLFTLSYVMGIFYTCYVCSWLRGSRFVHFYRALCCFLYGAAIIYSLLNLRYYHLFYIDRAAYYHRVVGPTIPDGHRSFHIRAPDDHLVPFNPSLCPMPDLVSPGYLETNHFPILRQLDLFKLHCHLAISR